MLAAVYGRVSTMRQENDETIENQLMAIKDFLKGKDLVIVKQYLDEGWSGTILVRPALDELRIDAKKKIWDTVVIYDPDRLARKYSYQELVLDELQDLGIQVLFVTTPPPADDSDKLLYGVKGLFAEYERAKITERFRLGRIRKARDGKLVSGGAPYGYQYIPRQGNNDGYYKVIKQEAETVKMIFEWIANEGLTIRGVVRRLYEMGIPPKRSKKPYWNTSSISNMYHNQSYIGISYFNKNEAIVPINPLKHEKYKKYKKTSRRFKPKEEWIPIPVPAIIDKDLFERAGAQLKANYELLSRNKKNDYLLAGVIYCVCGRRRTGEGPQNGKHLYYRCSDRVYSHPLPPKCQLKGVNARIADKLVWQGVSDLMSSPKLLNLQIQRWIGKKQVKSVASGDSAEQLKEEIEKIKKEEQRYIKAHGAEIISLDQLQEAMADLKTRRAILERQVGILESNKQSTDDVLVPSKDQIERFSEQAKLLLFDLSFIPKQRIIRKVVDTVISDQKIMRVRGYLPISEASLRVKEDQNVKFRSEGRDYWNA